MILNKRIPIRYLLGKIKIEILLVTIYAVTIQILDEQLRVADLAIPISLPALLGTAISLILAFRIGQSYDRWWEARKVWGAIVNDSRSLVRQVLTFPDSEDSEVAMIQKGIAHRQIAWCHALGQSLRGFDPHDTIRQYLSDRDIEFLKSHDNVPNGLLLLHSMDLEQLHKMKAINDFQEVRMDQTMSQLCDWMGMSERIKNTIFPKQYSLLVEFLLYLFVVMLPFGLVEYLGDLEAAVTIIITLPFFMLEKTALHLQDPFENKPTDVSVTAIADTIEKNIKQMLDEHFESEPQPDTFYVL